MASVYLLDIEGTTTSISFVYETLFPYIRQNLHAYVTEHFHSERVGGIYADCAADPTPGAPGLDGSAESLIAYLTYQMDNDLKVTPLKALQGDMWKAGYASGELKGHVFDDVLPAIQRWGKTARVCIYSSGSVAAQKLLFAYSEKGDVTPLLSGYFDTTTGPKKVASSYTAIARALDASPGDIHFLTDNLQEAEAAREAGLEVTLSVRPGNKLLGKHTFATVTSFDTIP